MRRRERGLTILEALLAATIGSLVALMALSILPSAMRALAASASELQASDLASEMMSRLESRNFSSLPVGTYDGRVPTASLHPGEATQYPPAPYPTVQRRFVEGSRERVVDYQIYVQVEAGKNRAGAVVTDLKTVKVSIFWREPRGAQMLDRSLSATTMVVNP